MKRSLLPATLVILLFIPLASADIDYRWEVEEQDTNPFMDPLIIYQEKNVLYQDASLKFEIRNSTYPDGIFKLKITNGTFALAEDPDGYHRYYEEEFYRDHWWEGMDDEILSEAPLKFGFDIGFILLPDLLDEDYWLEMELTVTEGGEQVYEEHHRIFVVGQPMVIEGSDFDVSDDIIRTYSISAGISIAFWGIIALIVILARKTKKEGGAK